MAIDISRFVKITSGVGGQPGGASSSGGIVTNPLTISGTPGPATVGMPYSFIPTITGGSGTKTVTLSSGSLAGTGLSINSATGEISGTPLSSGSITGLGFTVTDTAGGSATMTGKSIVVAAGGGISALTFASVPDAYYGVVRLSSWSGSCLRIRRASDNVEQDFGFVANVVDKAAIDTFIGGSTAAVVTLYDQSGGGNDMAQATAASQPIMTALSEWLGLRPVTFDGFSTTATKSLRGPLTADRAALTTFRVISPRVSTGSATYDVVSDAGFTISYGLVSAGVSTGTITNYGVQNTHALPKRTSLGIISVATGASGTRIRVDGSEANVATAVGAQAVGGLTLGSSLAGGNSKMHGDMFAYALFKKTMTSAEMQAVEAVLTTAFQPQYSFTKRLVYGGSSLIVSWLIPNAQNTPRTAGFGIGAASDVPEWEVISTAVGGRTLTSEAALVSSYNGLYDASKTANVVVIDAPSNELNSQTFADQAAAEAYATTLYNNTLLTFVSALKATAWTRVVVPTCIARGTLTNANFKEYARLKYNQLVVAGAAANGYVVSDRAGNAAFDATADALNTTYYYTDQVHVSAAGAAILAALDKAAILGP